VTARIRCFHVTTEQGAVFGAAATGKRDAMSMVQDRLRDEESDDRPATVSNVGPWPGTEYGTVLCYTGPKEATP
jgi:hypothetical protein